MHQRTEVCALVHRNMCQNIQINVEWLTENCKIYKIPHHLYWSKKYLKRDSLKDIREHQQLVQKPEGL